jgi:transposase InsO family protein
LSDQPLPDISLPSAWPKNVKSAVLHVVSLAHYAIICARGWAANSINARVRISSDNARLKQDNQLLREELRIKDARTAKIDPRHRPYYPPIERMAILELKAARGWSLAQTARAFLVEPETIAAWLKRIDESGSHVLVQLGEPVNKFPDFVRHIVQRLKTLCPALGKVKIAQVLARAGLHLGVTTVGRMLKANNGKQSPAEPMSADVAEDTSSAERVVTAKRPNHVLHVDLTVVPMGGFWVPWLPFALPQRWPFCWWLAAVVDQFSRRVMGVAIFRKQPDCQQVIAFLAKTIRQAKTPPKYIISDKGSQFWCKRFKRWCKRRKIKPRFGAVGKYGSIAVIERFIRTLKEEGLRRILLPLRQRSLREHLDQWLIWFNEHRPHTALGGKTPDEAYRRVAPANKRPRWEPRKCWPHDAGCAGPKAKMRGHPGVRLELVVTYLDSQKHLPIVKLERAA